MRPGLLWALATLPLAPLSAFAYFFFEWLFFITKPSSISALPAAERVRVLFESPLPLFLPLLAVQAAASVLSAIRYPRARAIALAPGAAVFGALLLILIDNFTYTLIGVNSLTPWGIGGLVFYAALLLAAIAFAGWKLNAWMSSAVAKPRAAAIAVALTTVFAAAPLATALSRADVDASAPPEPSSGVSGSGRTTLPNILFLGIDGVDADSLSAYGNTRKTSPFLETLRAESLFFENAFSNVGRTHGSLVALLTGRLPFTTKVTFPPTILQGADASRSLLSVLKPLGYTTLQLGMRHYADAEDANLIGFDAANYRWQNIEEAGAAGAASGQADVFRRDVIDRFSERAGRFFGRSKTIDGFAQIQGGQSSPYWSDDRRVETLVRYFEIAPEPWFVHAHLLDTHCCAYHPKDMQFPEEPDLRRRAHDSMLLEADGHIQNLIRALQAHGRLEHTIVVIYSDHTNRWTTNGRVPLLIRFPSGKPSGRVAANVQLADVAPTMLDHLDVAMPEWMDGVSLLDEGRRRDDRPIFGISDISKREAVAPYLNALASAAAPNYGAVSVTLVSGSQWFELSLVDGDLDAGEIAGHTRPERSDVTSAAARALLMKQLGSSGFQVEHP